MKSYTAESKTCWSYAEAQSVIAKLKDAGAEAGISVGAIWFLPNTVGQATLCHQIIEQEGGFILSGGLSSLEADILAGAEKRNGKY